MEKRTGELISDISVNWQRKPFSCVASHKSVNMDVDNI